MLSRTAAAERFSAAVEDERELRVLHERFAPAEAERTPYQLRVRLFEVLCKVAQSNHHLAPAGCVRRRSRPSRPSQRRPGRRL